MATPTEKEIEDAIAKCCDLADSGQNPFWGMTYLDGVRAALDWVTGNTDEHPLEE